MTSLEILGIANIVIGLVVIIFGLLIVFGIIASTDSTDIRPKGLLLSLLGVGILFIGYTQFF